MGGLATAAPDDFLQERLEGQGIELIDRHDGMYDIVEIYVDCRMMVQR